MQRHVSLQRQACVLSFFFGAHRSFYPAGCTNRSVQKNEKECHWVWNWNKSRYVYSIHASYLYIHLHSQSCICTWYSRGTNFPLSPANWVPWRLTAWRCQTPAQIPLPPAARRGPCLQQAPGKLPSVWMEQVATSTNQTPKGKRYLCDYVCRICIFKCTNELYS